MIPEQPSKQELAKVALAAAQRHNLGRFDHGHHGAFVFKHILKQDALFERIAGSHAASASTRHVDGKAASVPSWFKSIDGKGLLVDTGAVRQLTGAAFVESQVKGMETNGFHAIWSYLAKPEYVRGAGGGRATVHAEG